MTSVQRRRWKVRGSMISSNFSNTRVTIMHKERDLTCMKKNTRPLVVRMILQNYMVTIRFTASHSIT